MKNKKSVIHLTILNIVGAIMALAYSIIQVRLFGVSREIEIYFAATSLIYLILSLTQSGQLAEVFLPYYHRLKGEHDSATAHKAFSVIINRMVIITILISILTYAISPLLIELIIPGFSNADKELAIKLFDVFIPFFFLEIINSFFTTLLNAEKVYGKTELTNVINTIVSIIFLLIFYNKFGIWSLAIGMLIGKIVQFIMTLFFLPKINFKYYFIFKSPNFDHQTFFKTIFSTLTYVGATQVYNVILTSSISFLPVGVFAVFKYVQNLFTKVRGIFIAPINTVFFTEFSQSLNKSPEELSLIVQRSINYSLFILFSVLAFTIALGDKLLFILWGSKKFDHSFLELAYSFLVLNFISLIFIGIGSIYRRICIVYNKAKELYFYFSIVQIITASITYFLIKYFDVEGLKWIIIINVFLLHGSSFLIIYFYKNELVKIFNFSYLLKLLAFSSLLIIIGVIFKNYLSFNFSLNIYENSIFNVATDFLVLIIIYFFAGILIKIQEIWDLFRFFKGKLLKIAQIIRIK